MPLNRFDPYSKITLDNPFPSYAALLEGCPVKRYRVGEDNVYVVSRQQDIKAVLRDVEVWSSRFGPCPKDLPTENGGLNSDAPIHTEWRRIFASRFTPQAIAKHEATVRRTANGLIDQMLMKQEVDLHDDYSSPLVVQLMAQVVGLPPEDYRLYKECADKALFAAFQSFDASAVEESMKIVFPMLEAAAAERHRLLAAAGISEPGPEHVGTVVPDDLISALVCSRWQARRMTLDELLNSALAFFGGGAETTSSWILSCMYRLLEVPKRWDRLQREPALLPQVLEETLRHDPPVLGLFRKSVTPSRLHSEDVPEHSRLMYAIAAANRDPALFSCPNEFVMDRPLSESRKHISFGYGSHICPGVGLARLEAPMALSLLMERVPSIRLAGVVQRIDVFNYWGYKKFPVVLSS